MTTLYIASECQYCVWVLVEYLKYEQLQKGRGRFHESIHGSFLKYMTSTTMNEAEYGLSPSSLTDQDLPTSQI